MTLILAASFLVMLASLAGVMAVWKRAGRVIENNLDFLISLSAGVFAVILYNLGSETLLHAQSVGTGFLWILGGALGIWVLFKFLPTLHSHSDEHEGTSEQSIDVRRMLLSDGVHNLGDGILLAASFAVGPFVGIATTVSVFAHELIQEVSEFFVLRAAGYSSRQALKLNFIVSGTILIGALGGYFLLDAFEALEAPLLGLSAGMLLVVVLHDLIPHSFRTSGNWRHTFLHILWFAIGAVLMFGLTTVGFTA